MRFTEDHTCQPTTHYEAGELLCVRPENWDNREEGVRYAGEIVPLHRLELVQYQRTNPYLQQANTYTRPKGCGSPGVSLKLEGITGRV